MTTPDHNTIERTEEKFVRYLNATNDRHGAMRAAIAAYEAALWQPIESAPKDGRAVLCYGHRNAPHIEPMMYYQSDPDRDNGCWGWLEGDTPRRQPTHWRPLPSPPNDRP